MRGPAARFIGIALAAAGVAAATPASAERYEDGLAAYNRSDYSKSLKLLRAAAEKGDERAQYLLGRQFQFGQGVKADRAEAFFWYKRAEAKGHLEAKLFRQLLEKRWKITGDEKGRAERKLTALSAPPKPAPAAVAETAQKIKPEPAKAEKAKAEKAKPEKSTQTAALKESAAAKVKAKPAPTAERAKPEPAAGKAKPETLRTRLQEPPKPETSRAEAAKPAEKPAMVAARNTPETDELPSAVLRGTTSTARMPARPPVRDDDDDDDGQPRNGSPPPETRTPVAALPTRPPPSDHDGYQYPPSYAPSQPNYPPPSPPYYGPGPGPYYAPAPPPQWRGFYGPRPQYRPWGYRAHVGYMHPGWRGSRRW